MRDAIPANFRNPSPLKMMSTTQIPAGVTRELTDTEELRGYAIKRDDYFEGTRFFLVTWADRSGWYCTTDDKDILLATVGNLSEEFATVAAVEAFLYSRVEVTS